MSETWIRAVVLVCTFGAVLLLVETLVSALARTRTVRREINQRLRVIASGRSREEALSVLRRPVNDLPDRLSPWLGKMVLKFERMMIAAQIRAPIGRLLTIIVAAPVLVFLIVTLLVGLAGGAMSFGRILLIGTFAVVVGVLLPILLVQVKANRTRKKMQEQFPVALDVFVRGLRAGHPIASALDLLTVEMPDPIGSQFGIVVDEVTYGADLRDALQAMAERWDSDEIRMFVVSLAVQSETGGNLAEVLENLARVIRERASMMMKVRALSSEGRMTAIMLTVLPVFAFTLLFLFNPSFYLDVAGDPAFVPGFGGLIILYIIGFITIRRMVDLKV